MGEYETSLARPMLPDPLEQSKNDIVSRLERELDQSPFAKNLLKSGLTRGQLDAFVSPIFKEVTEGESRKLSLSTLCETDPQTHHYTSSTIGYLATAGCRAMLQKQNYPEAYVEAEVKVGVEGTNTIYIARDGKDRAELFRLEYFKKHVGNFGSLRFVFDATMPTRDPTLPSKLYAYIWKSIILSSKRMSMYDKTADADELEGLGMQIYKGNMNIDDIGGYELEKEKITRDIFYPFLHRDTLDAIISKTRKAGFEPISKPVLFYGPSGTGKTLMAKAIAGREGTNFIYFNLSSMYSKWVGASAKKMKDALDFVEKYSKAHGKTVFFIDEIDSLGKRQGDTGADMENTRVINTLLVRIDGMATDKSNKDLLIIGSTNKYDSLDSALLSRFSSKIFFDRPSKSDREKILNIYARHLPKADLEKIAEKTDGLVGRDIEAIAGIAERSFCRDLDSGKTREGLPAIDYYINAISEFSKKKPAQSGSAMYS